MKRDKLTLTECDKNVLPAGMMHDQSSQQLMHENIPSAFILKGIQQCQLMWIARKAHLHSRTKTGVTELSK